MAKPLWKTLWRLLKTLEVELPYDPAIPLLGIYLKKTKTKTLNQKATCTSMYTAALFTTAQIWKQPYCPSTEEWIKKMWYICTMDTYSDTIKNDSFSLAANWMTWRALC